MPTIRQQGMTPRQIFFRSVLIVALTVGVGVLVHSYDYTYSQVLACSVFAMTVLATLLF